MKIVEGHEFDSRVAALLDEGESAVFAARPSYATVRDGARWDATTLVLTNRRMLIKDRLIGKPKADFAARWNEVERVEGALWKGGGPKIQLLVHTTRSSQPVELIVDPRHASDVESAIRSGYLA